MLCLREAVAEEEAERRGGAKEAPPGRSCAPSPAGGINAEIGAAAVLSR